MNASAGAAVHAYLAKQIKTLRRGRRRVERREDDAVRRMRVATRRLRSLLAVYAYLYAEIPLSRKRLRWLAAKLGDVRDLELLRTRFAARLDGDEPDWFLRLAAEEERAYGRLERAFARKRFAKLMRAAEAMAATPHFSLTAVRPAGDVLPADIEAAQARLATAIAATGDSDDARHEARKAAKRTRYTAEAAAKALGEPAASIAADAEALQTILGACQDDAVAIAYLETHAPETEILESERRAYQAHLEQADTALTALRDA